ncbi:hypothetical protein P5712_19660 [Methylobacterium fujisawaense]|nr:hypothetical protein [Methylobacterium fujisawaense]
MSAAVPITLAMIAMWISRRSRSISAFRSICFHLSICGTPIVGRLQRDPLARPCLEYLSQLNVQGCDYRLSAAQKPVNRGFMHAQKLCELCGRQPIGHHDYATDRLPGVLCLALQIYTLPSDYGRPHRDFVITFAEIDN